MIDIGDSHAIAAPEFIGDEVSGELNGSGRCAGGGEEDSCKSGGNGGEDGNSLGAHKGFRRDSYDIRGVREEEYGETRNTGNRRETRNTGPAIVVRGLAD